MRGGPLAYAGKINVKCNTKAGGGNNSRQPKEPTNDNDPTTQWNGGALLFLLHLIPIQTLRDAGESYPEASLLASPASWLWIEMGERRPKVVVCKI